MTRRPIRGMARETRFWRIRLGLLNKTRNEICLILICFFSTLFEILPVSIVLGGFPCHSVGSACKCRFPFEFSDAQYMGQNPPDALLSALQRLITARTFFWHTTGIRLLLSCRYAVGVDSRCFTALLGRTIWMLAIRVLVCEICEIS